MAESEEGIDFARVFAELAEQLVGQGSMPDTLDDVLYKARVGVAGCEYAGVSLVRSGGRIETPASSTEVRPLCGEAQHQLGEGPTLDAIRDGSVVTVTDTGTDERWPRFAALAAEQGIASLVATRLDTFGETLGALTLYSSEVGAFDDRARELTSIYATHASIAIATQQREEQLQQAIATRESIGEAVGILIERHKLTPQQAFELLARASQHLNIKVRELADYTVETGLDLHKLPPQLSARHGATPPTEPPPEPTDTPPDS